MRSHAFLGVDTTSAGVTITLPPAHQCIGRIKYIGQTAGSNGVTVQTSSPDSLTGSGSVTVAGGFFADKGGSWVRIF